MSWLARSRFASVPQLRPEALLLLVLAVGMPSVAISGEVSGLPPHVPPTLKADYQFFLGNDFAAPGTNDDYRTQQIIATGRFRNRWVATLDHSIMTRVNVTDDNPQRIDTMTFTLGYEFFRSESVRRVNSLLVGTGVRGVGNYEGSRMQNGFHRLIESGTTIATYTDTRQTDPVFWFQAERSNRLHEAMGDGWFNGWSLGYWVRAGALSTTDGQIDGVAGLYGVAQRGNFDLWLGLRQDWRTGYTADRVLRDTAAEESKTAISLGIRFGTIVIETVARLDSEASFGQVSFVSSPKTRQAYPLDPQKLDLQATLHVPHMTFQLASRWYRRVLTSQESSWDESIIGELRGGQPQLGQDPVRYIETIQATVGLEWSRPINQSIPWLRYYNNIAAGVRNEKLLGRDILFNEASEAISRGVVVAEAGLEFSATRLSARWRHALRLGVTGWYPFDSAIVSVGGQNSEILKPGVSIVVGWVFNYH